jgi:hypothetical protein
MDEGKKQAKKPPLSVQNNGEHLNINVSFVYDF